ncbi:hypothetical protein GCM10020001_083660 [Nonomuraea salmonea]
MPAPIVRTNATGSTILNLRKNSIDFSGTFSAVGQATIGAEYGISVEVSTTASTRSHGSHR